jgi:hypothetical protein
VELCGSLRDLSRSNGNQNQEMNENWTVVEAGGDCMDISFERKDPSRRDGVAFWITFNND